MTKEEYDDEDEGILRTARTAGNTTAHTYVLRTPYSGCEFSPKDKMHNVDAYKMQRVDLGDAEESAGMR